MKVAASIAGEHGGGPHRAKLVHVQREARKMVMEDTEGHNFLKMVALTLEDKQKLLSSLEHMMKRCWLRWRSTSFCWWLPLRWSWWWGKDGGDGAYNYLDLSEVWTPKCLQCDFTSSWADGLRRHLRTHTGEKVIQMQPVRLCFLSYKRLEEIF